MQNSSITVSMIAIIDKARLCTFYIKFCYYVQSQGKKVIYYIILKKATRNKTYMTTKEKSGTITNHRDKQKREWIPDYIRIKEEEEKI